jgi:membrane protease YdiL (CAAX protease family)
MHGHLGRLFALIGLVIGGLVLTALFSMVLKLMSGMSLMEIQEHSAGGTLVFSAGETRALLIAQHILGFILPGLAFAWLYYRPTSAPQLGLSKSPGGNLALLGVLFLLAAYPLVNLSFMVNESFPLPDWAATLEQEARKTMELIIDMPTPWIFLLNLVIIGILPGIGEELVFRGILQKELGGLIRSPIAAIWISAFIFSAIHFQLEGLLPRMVLGVILGYLYYWTKNLWVPIIAHAMNNGIQVMLIYFTGMEMTEVDEQTSQLQVWMIPLSVGAMYWLARSITKNRQVG